MPTKFTTPTSEKIPKRLSSDCKFKNFKGTLICDFNKMPIIQATYSCYKMKFKNICKSIYSIIRISNRIRKFSGKNY